MSTPLKPIKNTSKPRSQGIRGTMTHSDHSEARFSRSGEVMEEGLLCRVVAFPARLQRVRFELQTLEGKVLGKYSYITDALDEARAYDIEHTEHEEKP